MRRYRPTLNDLEGRIVLSDLGVVLPGDLDPTATLTVTAAPSSSDSDAATMTTTADASSSDDETVSAMVAAAPALAHVEPDAGTTVLAGSTSFLLSFDPSVDSFSFDPSSIVVVSLGSAPDGTDRVIPSSVAPDPTDPSGQRLVVTTTVPLAPGTYQIRIGGDLPLMDQAGNPLTEGTDPIVGQFEVTPPALATPPPVVDLGPVSETPVGASGEVDPTNPALAQASFSFHLPEGQWDLSVGLASELRAITLNATVLLYDAQGQPVAGGAASSGPAIRSTLAGGDYTAVVSGSGAFRLRLSATPAVLASRLATSVSQIHLDQLNAYSDQATGLTVTFSAPVDTASFVSGTSSSLELVDGSGRTWSLAPFQTNASRTSVSLLFGQAMPAGTYQLRIRSGASPVDALGQPVVGADASAGTLGTVTFQANPASSPTDLGTLWNTVGSSVETTEAVAPGATLTRTFTSFSSGSEQLSIFGPPRGWSIAIKDANGNPISFLGAADASYDLATGMSTWSLVGQPGSYTIEITNQTDVPHALGLSLSVVTSDAASLPDYGVGQSDMFQTRTVASWAGINKGLGGVGNLPTNPTQPSSTNPPGPNGPATSTPTIPTAGAPDAGTTTTPSPGSVNPAPVVPVSSFPAPERVSTSHEPIYINPAPRGSSGDSTGVAANATSNAISVASPSSASAPASSGLAAPGESLLSMALSAGLPVGLPASGADRISVVGPAETPGSFTLASNRQGLGPGLANQAVETHGSRRSGSHGPLGRRATLPVAMPEGGDPTVDAAVQLAGDTSTRSLDRDSRAISESAWLGQLAAVVVDSVGGSPRIEADGDETGLTAAGTNREWAGDRQQVEYASLSSPVIVIGSALALYRVRFEIRRRGRQLAQAALGAGRGLVLRPLGRG